jgi:hypothetical protein
MNSKQIEEIANDLKLSNRITISSKTGYGISKLKAIIGNHTHIVSDRLA